MLERIFKYTVMVIAGVLFVAAWRPVECRAADSPRLQSAGVRWGSSYSWSRFRADQRSFRYQGVNRRNFRGSTAAGYRIFTNRSANRGAGIRSNLAAAQRTVRRSYGSTARYSSRQRIISWRKYAGRNVQRGATIGLRK
ncbi:MAG: hypothetical protein FVQ81_15260 [Candidatus Glassbacteria bacterium]|nr:hypothetical protein [Candidatus Glassbacteria bacterium]